MHVFKSRSAPNLVHCPAAQAWQKGESSEGEEWLGDRKARLPVAEVDWEIMWVLNVGRRPEVLN